MKLPILAYGHPVLRKKAEDIDKDYPGLNELIEDMYETMYAANGVGLAAPQVGKSIRLIVIDATPYLEDFPDSKFVNHVFINPVIKELTGEEETFNEGCLSVPDIREDVVRKTDVLISWYDRDFNYHEEVLDGAMGRVIQHEYDHLEGVLFVDRLNPLRKMLLKRKLSDISKGEVKADYKMNYPLAKRK